jgi:Protein of unknown function (DUF1194)
LAYWLIAFGLKKQLLLRNGSKSFAFIFSVLLSLAICVSSNAQQRQAVTLELVLALDSSASVDAKEFKLQLRGLARAFGDPDVAKAVAHLAPQGVAVAVMQWGGVGESRLIIPFTVLKSKADAIVFGFLIGQSRRRIRATDTSIASAIKDAQQLLSTNAFDGQRLVIDVSGDGPDNSGLDIESARQSARTAGITINGLPIEADENTVTEYYRNHVVIGADSFVEPAKDFEDYARAIRAKLLREFQPLAS